MNDTLLNDAQFLAEDDMVEEEMPAIPTGDGDDDMVGTTPASDDDEIDEEEEVPEVDAEEE